MKTIVWPMIAYALLVSLCSCSKDNDSHPAAGTGGAAAPAVAQGCPTFNGIYQGNDDDGGTLTYKLATKQEGSTYSYQLGEEDFIVANSGATPAVGPRGRKAEKSVTCGDGKVVFQTRFLTKVEGQQDGDSVSFTDLGGDKLRSESNDQSLEMTKQ